MSKQVNKKAKWVITIYKYMGEHEPIEARQDEYYVYLVYPKGF